jgi:hypothetical protein
MNAVKMNARYKLTHSSEFFYFCTGTKRKRSGGGNTASNTLKAASGKKKKSPSLRRPETNKQHPQRGKGHVLVGAVLGLDRLMVLVLNHAEVHCLSANPSLPFRSSRD